MALFDTGVQSNRVATAIMIEMSLGDLGYDPKASRIEREGASHGWQIVNGSATARIIIRDGENYAHMRLESTLMTITKETARTALLEHLLRMNHQGLVGCAFSLDGDRVCMVAERPTLDLDQSEVSGMLRQILAYADMYDDLLVDKFKGELGEH